MADSNGPFVGGPEEIGRKSPELATPGVYVEPTRATFRTRMCWIWSRPEVNVFTLHSVCMVGWPLVAFVSLFVADAPIRDAADEAARIHIIAWVWSYPLLFGATLAATYILKELGVALSYRLVATLLPWVLPVLGIYLAMRTMHGTAR